MSIKIFRLAIAIAVMLLVPTLTFAGGRRFLIFGRSNQCQGQQFSQPSFQRQPWAPPRYPMTPTGPYITPRGPFPGPYMPSQTVGLMGTGALPVPITNSATTESKCPGGVCPIPGG